MTIVTTTETPMGPFTWISSEGRVLVSGWTTDVAELVQHGRVGDVPVPGPDETTAEAIARFFGGDPGALDAVPVDQHGGEFIEAGWQALRRIPVGHTLTYTELAAEAGRPSAVRAAASACATNRCALFVPCHRVIRSDGSLGGFRWGLAVKRELLDFERRFGAGASQHR